MLDLLSLIDAWRQAKRAALSEDYAAFRPDYARRAEAYKLCIQTNIRRLMR